MRFFTSEWWAGKGGPGTADAYRQHFEAIRHQLPADLVHLHEGYSLHDGHVRLVAASAGTPTLRIVVDTWDDDNCYRRLALEYGGVTGWRAESTGQADLADPGTWRDLGYHEVDVAGEAFEHRMIFDMDVELAVRFEKFRLVIEEGPPNPPTQRAGGKGKRGNH